MCVSSGHNDGVQALLRLRRWSGWLAWGSRLLMVLVPLPTVLYLVGFVDPTELTGVSGGGWPFVAHVCIALVPVVLSVLALWHAQCCLTAFSRGRLFSAEVVRGLRAMAGWVALVAFSHMVAGVLDPLVLSWSAPEGSRVLAMGVNGEDLLAFCFAGLVWALSEVLAQAQRIEAENRSFV